MVDKKIFGGVFELHEIHSPATVRAHAATKKNLGEFAKAHPPKKGGSFRFVDDDYVEMAAAVNETHSIFLALREAEAVPPDALAAQLEKIAETAEQLWNLLSPDSENAVRIAAALRVEVTATRAGEPPSAKTPPSQRSDDASRRPFRDWWERAEIEQIARPEDYQSQTRFASTASVGEESKAKATPSPEPPLFDADAQYLFNVGFKRVLYLLPRVARLAGNVSVLKERRTEHLRFLIAGLVPICERHELNARYTTAPDSVRSSALCELAYAMRFLLPVNSRPHSVGALIALMRREADCDPADKHKGA